MWNEYLYISGTREILDPSINIAYNKTRCSLLATGKRSRLCRYQEEMEAATSFPALGPQKVSLGNTTTTTTNNIHTTTNTTTTTTTNNNNNTNIHITTNNSNNYTIMFVTSAFPALGLQKRRWGPFMCGLYVYIYIYIYIYVLYIYIYIYMYIYIYTIISTTYVSEVHSI